MEKKTIYITPVVEELSFVVEQQVLINSFSDAELVEDMDVTTGGW